MSSRKFTTDTPLQADYLDASGRLSPTWLVFMAQYAATQHSVELGIGAEHLIPKSVAWVMSRVKYEMDRYPKLGETLRIETWGEQGTRGIFPRYFLFKDGDGGVIGRASSIWMLIDIERRRPTSGAGVIPDFAGEADFEPSLELPGKIKDLAEQAAMRRPVCYSDIDLNGHMNNQRYVEWICDLLPYDLISSKRLARFQINYLSEMLPAASVELYLSNENGAFNIKGMCGGTLSFQAEGLLE